MKLAQLIRIIHARRGLFLLVLISTVGAVTAYSLLKSKTYQAEVALVVDAKNIDLVTGSTLPQQMQATVQATQADVLSSHSVALKVVDTLQLTAVPQVRRDFSEDTQGASSIRDWLADKLRAKLTVRSSHDSNVITLTFEGRSPELAAQIANAFAEGYVQTSLELRIDPAKRQTVWFDEQLQSLRRALETAQKQLSDYQQQSKIVGTDARLDIESSKLNEITNQLVIAQAAMYDAESRQKQMSHALQKNQLEELPDILSNTLLQNLKADLVRAEGRLAQVAQRYDLNHPENVSAAAAVHTFKSKLVAEIATVQGSINQAAQMARVRVNEGQRALEAQKQKVLELKQQRDGLDLLNREVENAQRAYDAAMQRTNEVRLTSRLDQTNIAVLNPATPPAKPAGPKVLRNILLAVLAGTLLATGVTLALEQADRRVRSGSDLRELAGMLDLTVFAEIRH